MGYRIVRQKFIVTAMIAPGRVVEFEIEGLDALLEKIRELHYTGHDHIKIEKVEQ